jgi:hypothetical protein
MIFPSYNELLHQILDRLSAEIDSHPLVARCRAAAPTPLSLIASSVI